MEKKRISFMGKLEVIADFKPTACNMGRTCYCAGANASLYGIGQQTCVDLWKQYGRRGLHQC